MYRLAIISRFTYRFARLINIFLVCEGFHASVILSELGLDNKSFTDTYNKINNLSAEETIGKNVRAMKIKFGIENIPIENHRLLNMNSMPKMHKNPIITRFIVVSPRTSRKPSPELQHQCFV